MADCDLSIREVLYFLSKVHTLLPDLASIFSKLKNTLLKKKKRFKVSHLTTKIIIY